MKHLFVAIGMLMVLMFTTSVSYALECRENQTIVVTKYTTVGISAGSHATNADEIKCYDEGWINGFLIGGGIAVGAAIVVGSAIYFLAPDYVQL